MDDQLVYLQCIKESSRLRVRIISPGFLTTANCQFPRALRQEGRYFSCPLSAVQLAATAGTYFYRVRDPITILERRPTAAQLRRTRLSVEMEASAVRSRQRRQIEEAEDDTPVANLKVFENEEEPDCAVCLDKPKQVILVPCGHYCLCKNCAARLDEVGYYGGKKCPMCRQPVQRVITPDMIR